MGADRCQYGKYPSWLWGSRAAFGTRSNTHPSSQSSLSATISEAHVKPPTDQGLLSSMKHGHGKTPDSSSWPNTTPEILVPRREQLVRIPLLSPLHWHTIPKSLYLIPATL